MAIPFLLTLNKRQREAYPIIQGGVARGLSSRAIESTLVGADRTIRRQVLLDIIRNIKDVERKGAQLRFLRSDRFPDPRRMPEALTKMRRAFSFLVELRGVELGTDTPFTRFLSISLDKPKIRADIEGVASRFIEDTPTLYGIDLESVLLVNGLKAGPEGTNQ